MPIIHLRKVLVIIRKADYMFKYKGIFNIFSLKKALRKVVHVPIKQ